MSNAMPRLLRVIVLFTIGVNLCHAQQFEGGARLGVDLLHTKQFNFITRQYEYGVQIGNLIVIHGAFGLPIGDYIPEVRIGFALGGHFTGKEIALRVKAFLIEEKLYGIAGGWLHWNSGLASNSQGGFTKLFELLGLGLGVNTSDIESLEILFLLPFEDLGYTRHVDDQMKPIKFLGVVRISYGLMWRF
jgi:hypothetical protein